ncbi:MAG: hypothetical protein BWK76_27390 [Desulfobulbaceae bacterium A2]|nr:MAG: hypothetical protein BWK76_27390 [Desulfobulbaceae bacterium A2]
MATITFGGLATGLDTNTIISQLMALERKPIERLENDKSYLTNRLAAFSELNDKLKALSTAFESMNTADELAAYSATTSTSEYIGISASSSALAGSYEVEVQTLARQQKSITNSSYASKTEGNFGTGTITITTDSGSTDIGYSAGDSLSDIMGAINAANTGDDATGVSASIINDGTGYRLVLTGEDAETDFTAAVVDDGSGTYDLSALSTSQTAQLATIEVDGVTMTSKNNTFSDAIPGVTLTLNKVNVAGEVTRVDVSTDTSAVKAKIDKFVSAYNSIVTFVDDQADASWGKDSSLQAVKRNLQNLLVTKVDGSGDYNYLVDLGFKTDKDTGLISVTSSTIEDAIKNNLEDVEKLFVGESGVTGIAELYMDYVDSATDSVNGIYASRKTSTENNISRIEDNITSIEARLVQREATLRAQFSAMEQLVSSMNSVTSYLSTLYNNN